MRVSVIIPCYNEEDTIAEVVRRVKNVDVGYEKEILVIDDGSTDTSASIVNRIGGARIIRHDRNRGKGMAVQTGLRFATGDVVVIQDADMEYPPEGIPRLLKPIVKNEAEVVYGSRFLGTFKNMTFWHLLGNKVLSLAASLLYNVQITDIMTGHKVFRRRARGPYINDVRQTTTKRETAPEQLHFIHLFLLPNFFSTNHLSHRLSDFVHNRYS